MLRIGRKETLMGDVRWARCVNASRKLPSRIGLLWGSSWAVFIVIFYCCINSFLKSLKHHTAIKVMIDFS